jgi:hypothetical protein
MSTRICSLILAVAAFHFGILPTVLADNGGGAFETVPKPANLDWRAIESDDYRTYIKNLQAANCPALTIRDIVTADVVSVFGAKREEAVDARFVNYQYWKSDAAQTEARAIFESQRESIDSQTDQVLQKLLGTNTPLPEVSREWSRLEFTRELDFLSPDKRDQAAGILLKSEKVNEQIKELAGGINLSEDTNALQRVLENYDSEKAALRELLSPNEYQLVQLSTSWTSENLRQALTHFEPSEKEFRKIFAAWQPHDEYLARLRANGEDDPGNADVYAKIKGQLTEARYSQYCNTWWK